MHPPSTAPEAQRSSAPKQNKARKTVKKTQAKKPRAKAKRSDEVERELQAAGAEVQRLIKDMQARARPDDLGRFLRWAEYIGDHSRRLAEAQKPPPNTDPADTLAWMQRELAFYREESDRLRSCPDRPPVEVPRPKGETKSKGKPIISKKNTAKKIEANTSSSKGADPIYAQAERMIDEVVAEMRRIGTKSLKA